MRLFACLFSFLLCFFLHVCCHFGSSDPVAGNSETVGNVSNLPWALMAAQREKGAREDLRVEADRISAAASGLPRSKSMQQQWEDSYWRRQRQINEPIDNALVEALRRSSMQLPPWQSFVPAGNSAPRPSPSSCASHEGSAGNPRGAERRAADAPRSSLEPPHAAGLNSSSRATAFSPGGLTSPAEQPGRAAPTITSSIMELEGLDLFDVLTDDNGWRKSLAAAAGR